MDCERDKLRAPFGRVAGANLVQFEGHDHSKLQEQVSGRLAGNTVDLAGCVSDCSTACFTSPRIRASTPRWCIVPPVGSAV
jgi:hypothetical protein